MFANQNVIDLVLFHYIIVLYSQIFSINYKNIKHKSKTENSEYKIESFQYSPHTLSVIKKEKKADNYIFFIKWNVFYLISVYDTKNSYSHTNSNGEETRVKHRGSTIILITLNVSVFTSNETQKFVLHKIILYFF